MTTAASQKGLDTADAKAGESVRVRMTGAAMPLPMLRPGVSASVERVLAGGEGISRKLSAMGIVPGVRVTILNAQSGPLLLKVGDSRYAIGRGMAHGILVVPCDQP